MKVMVIAPHPDDMEIFVGGTIAKHVREGDEVVELLVTDGEWFFLLIPPEWSWCPVEQLTRRLGTLGKRMGKIRRRESEQAAAVLGARVRVLGLEDRFLSRADPKHLLKPLEEEQPELLYAPDPDFNYRGHPDHLWVGRVVSSFRPIRFYESSRPNLRVDIHDTYKQKMAALECHRSQLLYCRLILPPATAFRWRWGNRYEEFRVP